jgi:hypothetical protein
VLFTSPNIQPQCVDHITQTAKPSQPNHRHPLSVAIDPIHGDGIEMSDTPAIRPSEADRRFPQINQHSHHPPYVEA